MKELTIPLKTDSRIPLYEQIYEYIKCDMKDGKISPGEKLPSTRFLAKHLQISRSTVELAYEQLLSEGYVRTVPCSGYFVCEIESELTSRISTNIWSGTDVKWQSSNQKRTDYLYDFSPNAVEWPQASMTTWRKSIKCMMQEDMEGLFDVGDSQGEGNLRKAICDYLHQSRGVRCLENQIVIGAGNEYLLMLLYQMLGESQCIAMESPTYRQAYQIFCNLGWKVVPIQMDDYGMKPESLKGSGAQLAYIMPSHQFPMGNVMPLKRRMELLQWAGEESGRYIIEDDYDSEFRYKGKPIPSLQGSDPYERVIYLGTFSKSIAPAIRVSYMVLPMELLELYERRCGFYSSTVSRIQQQILYYFIAEGYFERHLNKMRRIYRSRHDVLINILREKAWVRRIYGESAGLHLLIEVDSAKTEEELVEQAKKQGVRIYSLTEYLIQEESITKFPTLLLGYAGLEEQQIIDGIALLEEIMK